MPSKKQIIYLNGPTSAGKSTLAKKLQDELQEPFLIVGIDMVISLMPEKLNDWRYGTKAAGFSWQPVKDDMGNIGAYKIETGPFGKQIVQALKDFDVVWIGVTAPLEVLEKRERERGDRKLTSCGWQAERVHTKVQYDIMVDTSQQSLDEIVENITTKI